MPVTKQDLIFEIYHVKMPPNLSMSTGFGLFRKSNLLTAHEHVANSYIDAFMYIHLPLLDTVTRNLNLVMKKRESEASGSYRSSDKTSQEPSHSRTKKKVAYNYSDP